MDLEIAAGRAGEGIVNKVVVAALIIRCDSMMSNSDVGCRNG